MVVEEVSAVYFKNPSKTHKTNKEQTPKANKKKKKTNNNKTSTHLSEVATIFRALAGVSVSMLRIRNIFEKILGLHIKPTTLLYLRGLLWGQISQTRAHWGNKLLAWNSIKSVVDTFCICFCILFCPVESVLQQSNSKLTKIRINCDKVCVEGNRSCPFHRSWAEGSALGHDRSMGAQE